MKTKEQRQQLIKQLKEVPVVTIACKRANISPATFYRWKKQNKVFARQADEALLEGDLLVTDVAKARVIGAIKDGDLNAAKYWLKYKSKEFTEKREVVVEEKETRLDEEKMASFNKRMSAWKRMCEEKGIDFKTLGRMK